MMLCREFKCVSLRAEDVVIYWRYPRGHTECIEVSEDIRSYRLFRPLSRPHNAILFNAFA